jgi:hypothetical protein
MCNLCKDLQALLERLDPLELPAVRAQPVLKVHREIQDQLVQQVPLEQTAQMELTEPMEQTAQMVLPE